jgi:NAD(P)-dependent dehydrogenase (short-subunit alcohol dehydrogenase family)
MGILDGRVVVVTGAGRGLGHGVARGLAQHGATVLAVAQSDHELAELAERVQQAAGSVATFSLDLADTDAVTGFARAALSTYGAIDALVNNAAVLRNKPFLDLPPQEFDATIEVNLLAPVRLTRAFLPAMIERGRGAIVNVSSAAGVRGFGDETDYCASKFGLEGFSYALALELQPHNISVNLVAPGYRIKPTSVTAAEFSAWPEERRAKYRDPIDMADAFAFLVLQDGSGITGQRFNAFELAERVRSEGWKIA